MTLNTIRLGSDDARNINKELFLLRTDVKHSLIYNIKGVTKEETYHMTGTVIIDYVFRLISITDIISINMNVKDFAYLTSDNNEDKSRIITHALNAKDQLVPIYISVKYLKHLFDIDIKPLHGNVIFFNYNNIDGTCDIIIKINDRYSKRFKDLTSTEKENIYDTAAKMLVKHMKPIEFDTVIRGYIVADMYPPSKMIDFILTSRSVDPKTKKRLLSFLKRKIPLSSMFDREGNIISIISQYLE